MMIWFGLVSANQDGFGFGAIKLKKVVLHPYLYLLQTGGEL